MKRSAGWPDHTDWSPTADEHNQLEQLADVAAHEIDASFVGAVSTPFSSEARAAIVAISDRLIAAGLPRELAEYGVTAWILMRRRVNVTGAVRAAAAPLPPGQPRPGVAG